jgi:phytoene/squalene synthetase
MSDSTDPKLDFVSDIPFEEILSNPILDIGARFWDEERYGAFRVTYRSMRILDDFVDNRKASGQPLGRRERFGFEREISKWTKAMVQKKPKNDAQRELLDVLSEFALPLWPWERLVTAMKFDLEHDGFPSLLQFMRYCEGAAIAPASVFMHLCGVTKKEDNYLAPKFDIRTAARPLALFSYFVHIVRDFEKDQKNGLCYFADDLLAKYRLGRDDLKNIADGTEATSDFRQLIAFYHQAADHFRSRARIMLDRLRPELGKRYRLSLEIIYALYYQIFERINPKQGSFSTTALNPTPDEVQTAIIQTVNNFDSTG